MFSMCGLLCRFLRGWRQNEAVGLMVHAASLKDASLSVENIVYMSKHASSLPDDENKSLFCQPFCVTVDEKRNQLLWRDNNKQAVLVSPKEKVDLVKWTGFLSSSPSNKEPKNESSMNHTSDEASLPQRTTPYSSRKNSTCSDCEHIVTVLLEASFRKKEEETLYGYNVLVEELAEPYAWKSSDIFGIIIHTTPTKLVTMIHAFFNNALIIDEDLSIRKIITVETIGEPSSFENPSTMSETIPPKPLSTVTEPSIESDPPIEVELVKANSISSPGTVTTFEAMKREGLRKNTEAKANGSIYSGPRHPPSLLEAKKLSSQSSEEDGSMESEMGSVNIHQLCPRGWAVSGLKPRSHRSLSTNQRVILGQPMSMNKDRMKIRSPNEIEASFNKHFQSSLFTSVIPNPLNEFFAVKEALNQKMQREKSLRQSKDKNSRALEVHKKGKDNLMKNSFTNPVFQYLPRFQKSFHSRSKDELGFSPKLYNRDYILKQDYLEADSFKRRFSVGRGHNIGSSPEPKVHAQPSKVKSEADLLKATNIIKDNLANIIENYLTKSPRVSESNSSLNTIADRKDPEVLLISDDKENSESILMVTVEETDLSHCIGSFENKSFENSSNISNFTETNLAKSEDELAAGSKLGSFYLNDFKTNSNIPNIFNFSQHTNLRFTKDSNLEIKSTNTNTVDEKISIHTSSSRFEPKILYSMNTENMKEKNEVDSRESGDSDTTEQSFSEDSLNEKVVPRGQYDKSDIELIPSTMESDKIESRLVSNSVRPKLALLHSDRISDFTKDMSKNNPVMQSDTLNQDGADLSENCLTDLLNKSKQENFEANNKLNEGEVEMSPLGDSVKSICNSVSFEEHSFSEDSLLNGKFLEDKDPTILLDKGSIVSTPEDFTCKADSLENLTTTEFPMHWHEEYVRIFSDVNQDLRECVHSVTDLLPNTLEPIAEMEYAVKDNVDINCETEIICANEDADSSNLLSTDKLGKIHFNINDSIEICSGPDLKKSNSDLQLILESSPLHVEKNSEMLETSRYFDENLCQANNIIQSDHEELGKPISDVVELNNAQEGCRVNASSLVSLVLEQAIHKISAYETDSTSKEVSLSFDKRRENSKRLNIYNDISEGYNSDQNCSSEVSKISANFLKTEDEISFDTEHQIYNIDCPQDNINKIESLRIFSDFSDNNSMSQPTFMDREYDSDSQWNTLDKKDESSSFNSISAGDEVDEKNNRIVPFQETEMSLFSQFNQNFFLDETESKYLSFGKVNETAEKLHDLPFKQSPLIDHSDNYVETNQDFDNSLPLDNPWILPGQFKNHCDPISLTERQRFSDFVDNCAEEAGGATGIHHVETSPLLRSGDDSFVFAQIAKAMLSPVDSASESGFASLKDSSHSEATSESGSAGVPLSKSKDSLDMTDSERDRTSGVHTLLDEFDAMSSITGDHIQTGSSPASMVSSARGSLMEDLVFGHSKELEVLDIENVKIPSVHTDTSLFPVNSSSLLAKRGKLISVASLDSDHRSAGFKFLDRFHSSQRRVDLFDFPDLHQPFKMSLENENNLKYEENTNIENTYEISHEENVEKIDDSSQQTPSIDNLIRENKLEKCKEFEENAHLTSKSGSEDSSSQAIQTSDSISSSDTIISRTSFDEHGKLIKDQSVDESDIPVEFQTENICNQGVVLDNQYEICPADHPYLSSKELETCQSFTYASTNKQEKKSVFEKDTLLKNEDRENDIDQVKQDLKVSDKALKGSKEINCSNDYEKDKKSPSSKHLFAENPSLKIGNINLSKVNKYKPKSFEEVRRRNGNIIQESKPLSKSLSGEANVLNGKIFLKHGFKHRKDIKSSSDSVSSLRDSNEGKISSQFVSDHLSKSSSSERSSESNHDRSFSSRSSTQTSSGSSEMTNDKVSLKSQDSLDKFSYFESICAQAKPRSRRKKVLSVEMESFKKEDTDLIHRSLTLPEGSFAKPKDERKKHKEEKIVKKKEEATEKEKKSTLQSLKGFLKRSKSKESKEKDPSSKKTSPSLFRKFEKKKGSDSSSKIAEKKSVVISDPTPIPLQPDGYSEELNRIEFLPESPAQYVNDKTHPIPKGHISTAREGVMKMGIKTTLHRSNALASSAYVSCSDSDASSSSNHSTPNTSPVMRKSNLNGSPRLYRKVLMRNVSSSQESIDGSPTNSPLKNISAQISPRRASESVSPVPLMGTKALLSSPKNFSVTIGFKPQVESNSNNRTLSVGDNLHNMSSSPVMPAYREVHSASSNLTKRSSSMEILVYGKIREHNPSRKRSAGGCSREGSFKLHREISVETLVEIPEAYPSLEEGEVENYQEYLQRVQESRDSRQSSTWSLCENEGSLSESMPLEKFSTHFPFPSHIPLHKKFSLPHNMHLTGPEEISISNPNLEPVGSSLIRGMPLSSSFTASPYKRPLSSAGSGVSPIKRVISSQGKNTTSPGGDSCPASPLFEEEEEFEYLKPESDESRPPNILVYTANNEEYFESVKETLLNTLSKDRYTIYHLTDEAAFKSPWKSHTAVLVVCGDVPTHVSTVFIRYLLSGGQVLSICSDFLNVAVPLFGTVEVQEASVVSMSYNKWKNVQLLHHQHCFHSSPKHKRFSRDLEKRSNTGSAVSVEPTFVEITDEYGVRHRLNLKVLAKDDTWGAPSLLVADVSENKGKALFSQVHLEKDPNQSISCELKGEQLKKSNENRLEILRDLLSTYLGLRTSKLSEEEARELNADYTPAYLMGRHEMKQKFMEELKEHLKDGRLDRHCLSISFHNKEDQCSIPSQSFLPILLTGYTKAFSTVKYFEELNTLGIGRLVIFCEVLSSTQNVVGGTAPLEHGTVVIAMQQKAGKGRYGNMWLSPLGCAMFSVQLHFPLTSNMGQCLPFLQHLIALSMVTGVTRIPGYEGIPLRVKWPNDIYLGSQAKIGGLIVEASIVGGRVIANAGCGVNLSNGNPTSCINNAIKEYNATEKKKLPELTREVLCANIFNQMEKLLKQFQEDGSEDVINEYYKYWLHGNARVTVQNEVGQTQKATVVGIDQFGYLKAELESGDEIILHPDGNSFNMMEGLIYSKVTKSSS